MCYFLFPVQVKLKLSGFYYRMVVLFCDVCRCVSLVVPFCDVCRIKYPCSFTCKCRKRKEKIWSRRRRTKATYFLRKDGRHV